MASRTLKSSRTTLYIARSPAAPLAHYYHVEDEPASFELDAFLLDFDLGRQPDALFVVLLPLEAEWPSFVYAPPKGLLGVPYEVAVTMALAAYRSTHPGLVPPPSLHQVSPTDGAEG